MQPTIGGRPCQHCVHLEISHSGKGTCHKLGGTCPCPGFSPRANNPLTLPPIARPPAHRRAK